MCGVYTNILRANFVKRTLLPIISNAFFDIYSASVSMCFQNFVMYRAFSCYFTMIFNLCVYGIAMTIYGH